MGKVFLRTEFNYDMNEASLEAGLKCEDPSLAQQQFQEESDINVLVERFGLTGEMPASPTVPQYGDFTGITDFQSAMNAVLVAQSQFMELPAKVRSRFDNDPQKLLEFVSDDSNREEARVLGLLKDVPVVDASPEAPKPV